MDAMVAGAVHLPVNGAVVLLCVIGVSLLVWDWITDGDW